MKPFSTPKLSTRTLAIGARQLVVQLALRDDVVRGLVVGLVVDADDDGRVRALGRRRDDDLLGAGLEVLGGLGALGEAAGGLDDDVGAELAPGQLGGVGLGGDADALAVDDERVLFDLDGRRGRRRGPSRT